MRHVPLIVAAVMVAGCPGSLDVAGSAIGVTVTIADDSPATCVRVVAKSGDVTRTTQGIVRGGKSELKVAIVPTAPDDGELKIFAQGLVPGVPYEAWAGCTEPVLLHEESEVKTARFAPNAVTAVRLELKGRVDGDSDNDGFRATSSGGSDCNDADPLVNPTRSEICSNNKDDNCNGGADCSDAVCSGTLCDDADGCTRGEACTGVGVCGGGQSVTCTTPPSSCHAATGTCGAGGCAYAVTTGAPCDGGLCRSDGACVPANVEVLCGDGIDNNGVRGADCADSDCNNQQCAAATGCTAARVCASSACAPAQTTCTTAPTPCHQAAGGCGADGGCAYPLRAAGSSCGSGNECSTTGACGPAETGAQCADGTDNDGDGTTDCQDSSCGGSSCNDGNACLAGETCSGTSCGGGMTVTCNAPPSECFGSSPPCDQSNGCQYPLLRGAGCGDGGVCGADGGCGPRPPYFAYAPSNFAATGLTSPDASVAISCNAVFVSDNPHSFPVWCGPLPQVVDVPGAGAGESAKMLVMDSLFVDAGSSLRLIGTRPVILAVLNDANIRGHVNAGSEGSLVGGRGSGGSTADPNFVPKTHCTNGNGLGRLPVCGSAMCGGGGGGAFGSAGGSGGPSAGGQLGGDGGIANIDVTLVPLRGGCNGGRGMDGSPAYGGNGGGVVQLSAGGVVTISGLISAQGAGGEGGVIFSSTATGGGGGGAAGGILIEAKEIILTSTARVTANGGAGGEGHGLATDTSRFGEDGVSGNTSSASETTGANGSATNRGGPGGDGAARNGPATAGGAGSGGTGSGGGGGGGVGRIRFNAQGVGCNINGSAVVSPAATSNGASNCP